MSMDKENLILSYRRISFPLFEGREFSLCETGKIEYIRKMCSGESNKKIVGNFQIPKEQVNSYVDRLLNSGILNLENYYHPRGYMGDGWIETTTFNYKGTTKSVSCRNIHHNCSKLNEILDELWSLVKEVDKNIG